MIIAKLIMMIKLTMKVGVVNIVQVWVWLIYSCIIVTCNFYFIIIEFVQNMSHSSY